MILMIDGNNLAHRCKHAYNLSNKGVDVSVTYGFLRNLASYMNMFKPTSVVVCWDGGVPDFRRRLIPSYKSNRVHGDPVEFADFLRQLHELEDYALPMMGVLSVRKAGAEADDLLYHATKILDGEPFVIVTTDKDLYQAVSDITSVYNPTKQIVITPVNFKDITGIDRASFVHWRALQGDSSDNIQGVNGVGEKTATKLFEEYKDITGIINAAGGRNPAGKITGKIADAINAFGFTRICNNVLITALYADRVGARQALVDAISKYQPANASRLKKYLLHNAFVSLMDNLPGRCARLEQPYTINAIFRMPIVCSQRSPVY